MIKLKHTLLSSKSPVYMLSLTLSYYDEGVTCDIIFEFDIFLNKFTHIIDGVTLELNETLEFLFIKINNKIFNIKKYSEELFYDIKDKFGLHDHYELSEYKLLFIEDNKIYSVEIDENY